MVWKIKWDERIQNDFRQIDKGFQKKIIKYMEERIAIQDNPRIFGKGLQYNKYGLWRYRVEDYRIICRINDEDIEILVITVSHRKDAYK